MEHPKFRRTPNGTLMLKASEEAQAIGPRQGRYRAKGPEEVEAEACAHVASEGGDASNATLTLSRWKVQFGRYQGQTFHWLLENDVGYAVNLVASHQKARERTGSQSPLMANKDAFTHYSSAYPDFLEAVRCHRAVEETQVKSLHPDQEGQALVGFGDFTSETLQSLYESEEPKKKWFVNYLRRTEPAAGSQMENAIRYVKKRDGQRASAAKDATSSSSNTASVLAALVSMRHSLSAVEMQAKVKKQAAPKPAFPASSFQPLPSRTSEEPTGEELVRAVVHTEESPAVPPHETLPSPPQAGPAFLPPPAPAGTTELLPDSWKAALTTEQQQWIGRMLFARNSSGLITELNLWWYPPQTHSVYNQPPATPDPFFACRLFLWMPHRIWRLQLKCPQPSCPGAMAKAGLYRTIRRVLDIDGWYFMATEYLECRRCKKKVGGWSQDIVRQLPPTYSCQFPAVLTYKLSCDLRVVAQLRSRSLGNSATRLYDTLREQHSDSWMRRAIQYLGVCEQFLALSSVRGQFPPPPQMPPLPSPIWLLTVYGYDVLTRLNEYKARITSTFGSILKMVTKKVTKKLAGTASDTAAWVTNVGNEQGQVLMSILACAEGSDSLTRMAAGLMRRYRDAGVPPPQLIYVDRDCCNRDGVSKTAALFPEWGQLVVRLDIWHLMRRFASGVTAESHKLYPTFMRQLSHCIFEVDPGDARRLTEAKRSELEGKHGMAGLTDAEVIRRISREEWRLHCRRRTRGAEETALLIQDLLNTFGGAAGRDTLDVPLLDALRIQDIWSTQRRHLSCIQDPPGMQLYTETGRLTMGGVSLPVYRCARGSTSLESFQLHFNQFIPGTTVSAKYFQAFLVDGVVRWNEDRAAAAAAPRDAAEGHVASLRSYSGRLKHVLNQKSQRVLGLQMVKDFTKPAAYTGELIGVEYLYQQTGVVLEEVSLDPDTPDEAAAVDTLEEVDEGIREDVGDPTIFKPDPPPTTSTAAAAQSSDPAEAPRSEPSSPAASHQHGAWERTVLEQGVRMVPAPAVADQPLPAAKGLSLEQVGQGQPFTCIPEEQPGPSSRGLPPPPDQPRPGPSSRGLPPPPDQPWPGPSSRGLPPPPDQPRPGPSSRGLPPPPDQPWPGPSCRGLPPPQDQPRPGPSSRGLPPPPDQPRPGPSSRGLPPPPDQPRPGPSCRGLPPPPDQPRPGPSSIGLPPPPDQPRPIAVLAPLRLLLPRLPVSGSAALPTPPQRVPRTTAYRKRKAAEAAAAGQGPPQGHKARRQTAQYTCSRCGQPKRFDTGHTRIAGVSFCAAASGKTVEEWREDMKRRDPPNP